MVYFWGQGRIQRFFGGVEEGFNNILGSNHLVDQLLFSIVPPILTFDFGVIFAYLVP